MNLSHLQSIGRTFAGGAFLLGFWIILFGNFKLLTILSGVVSSALVISLAKRLGFTVTVPAEAPFKFWLWIPYLGRLFRNIIRSTFRTLYLILTDKIEPKIVALHCEVDSDLGELFLLNSITITPTTIAILQEKGLVYIHHLDLRDREEYEELNEAIEGEYGEPLRKLLEE